MDPAQQYHILNNPAFHKELMDPNSTLALIEEYAENGINPHEACLELYGWLTKDGFQPDWGKFPKGAEAFLSWNNHKGLIMEIIKSTEEVPLTEGLAPGVEQVPFEGMEAIGSIFSEGETKYGRDNWKNQPDNIEYNRERTRHAIRHLMLWANGDRSEPHLAKVAWFCVTTIWREKHSGKTKD